MPKDSIIVKRLLTVLACDNWAAVKLAMAEVEVAGLWRAAALKMRRLGKPSPKICDNFYTMWVERGHRIRAHLADDRVLLDVLRVLLPSYSGSSLTLFRGESAARWRKRAYGSAWTSLEECALGFASGLNAVSPEGGVLLSTMAPVAAVIAGPNEHSIFLGEYEYVLDRRRLDTVSLLKRFPPSH